jgi:site-specific recombinase XerD
MLEMMKAEMARSSVRLRFAAMRAFYAFLHMRRTISKNVLLEVSLPKAEKQLPRFLTTSQVDNLIAAPAAAQKNKQAPTWMAARDTAVIELFYSTGMRLAELVGLDVRDVDPISETARVTGKGSRERVCPVGGPALEAIQRYRQAARVNAGPLFINKSRRRLSARAVNSLLKLRPRSTPACQPTCRRTSCVTALQPISWTTVPTCAASKPCSATRASRQRKSTRTSPSNA